MGVVLSAAAMALAQAQDLFVPSGRALPMPQDRRTIVVGQDERNPFGRIETRAPAPDLGLAQPESEESRLRANILRMPVQGLSISAARPSVVLGPMALTKGDELPPLFPNQLERIILKDVAPGKLTFAFVERDGSTDLRAFSRNFSIAPRVRYALPADVMDASGGRRPYPLRGSISAEGHETMD
jgi:hypothetical protein